MISCDTEGWNNENENILKFEYIYSSIAHVVCKHPYLILKGNFDLHFLPMPAAVPFGLSRRH